MPSQKEDKIKKFWITEEYLNNRELTPGAKLVAMFLQTNSSQDVRKGYSTWRVSNNTGIGLICDALGYSYAQVKRNIDLLKKMKLVEEVAHGFCINIDINNFSKEGNAIESTDNKEVDLNKISNLDENEWDKTIFGSVRNQAEIVEKTNELIKKKEMTIKEIIDALQNAFMLSKDFPWGAAYLAVKRQLEEKLEGNK